jgi:hypothetical protein
MTDSATTPKAEKLSAIKGMNDILPPDSARWEALEDSVRTLMRAYAYENIRTPIVEHTALFVRGLGEVTDIVEKEMYSFEDKLNGDRLTLRPENTAGVVRAAIEHALLYNGGKRLYYMGPMFRHERPQKGRYRQFHQIGVETYGMPGPDIDAELLLLTARLWQALGLPRNLRACEIAACAGKPLDVCGDAFLARVMDSDAEFARLDLLLSEVSSGAAWVKAAAAQNRAKAASESAATEAAWSWSRACASIENPTIQRRASEFDAAMAEDPDAREYATDVVEAGPWARTP